MGIGVYELPAAGAALHDVAHLLRKRFDQKARGVLGLTRAQWITLAKIKHNEGINQSALADMMELEPITLARIVDKLVAQGLVERRAHATDRRMRTLHMNRQATPVLEKMQRVAAAVFEEALAGVAPSDIDGMIKTLNAIKRNLSERDDPAESAVVAAPVRKVKHG
jgi:DNA-binding MarR family transcriptional regulator